MTNSQLNSPLLVARAKEFAGASYENDFNEFGERFSARFRSIFPDVETFVGRTWPKYLEAARQYHLKLLTAPEGLIPETEKEKIYEDLMAYNERRMRRRPAKVGIGPLMLRPDRPGTLEQRIFGKK